MKLILAAILLVLGIAWWILTGLEKRKVDLDGEIQELESARLREGNVRGVAATRAERVSLSEVMEVARERDGIFAVLEKLEGLDRNGLRTLALEVLDSISEKQLTYPGDKAQIRAREAVLSALAETDPLWLLEQAGERRSATVFVAFQNLLEDSPAEALRYYENLGEGRYSYPQGPGASDQLYQLVFNHLATRDPEAAVEHLFAMNVRIRNLPRLEIWGLQTVEQAKALWGALKKQEDDRFQTKSRVMTGAAQTAYELGGLAGLKELWNELGTGDERRQFLRYSGWNVMFQSQQGARDLQQLLADEPAGDRENILNNFVSSWGYLERAGVAEWVETLPPGEMRDQMLASLISNFMQLDERPRREWVEMIEGAELREKWLKRGE